MTRRRPWIMAAVVAVGLIGAWSVFEKSRTADRGGHAANSAMVQLTSPSSTQVRLAAPLPSLPEPAAVSSAPSPPAAPVPSPRTQSSALTTKVKPAKARAKTHSASAPVDLIAPDYAR